MNKRLKSRSFAALLTVLFLGFATSAQTRLSQPQNNQESVVKTNVTQASTSNPNVAADVYQISPLEAVKGKKEDFSKRDAYSKHFINDDGSNTALIGAGPIHYEKNGQFLDIDHSITRQSDPKYPFANTTNIFGSYFGQDAHTGVKNKTKEGELVEFLNTSMFWEVNGQAVGTRRSANTPIELENGNAYYKNLYGAISAEFITLTGKRKLNYVIPNHQALGTIPANANYLVFTEDVDLPEGWKSTVTKNGVLIQNPAGKEIYLYENPVSTDAANEMTREENTVFETVLNGDILTIMTKVKTEWLLSNDRQFPVKVDPTVSVYPNNATNWTRCIASNGFDYGSSLEIGNNSSYYSRVFFKFNSGTIPTGSNVNSVIGYLYVTGGRIAWNGQWQFASGGDPTSTSGTTLYNSTSLGLSAIAGMASPSNSWKSQTFYNPGGNTHIEDQINNGYLLVSAVPSGNWSSNQAYTIANHTSANRPYLKIDYTELSSDRTLSVSGAYDGATYANGDHTFDNNTAVTATSGTRAGYVVTGWTGTGSVPATGTTGSATFTITENSSITWQWEQTGTPNNVVFHNFGGTEQLAFNNSRVGTNTPTFRMSHDAYDANAYEVEINSSANFSGSSFTQEFSLTNPFNTQANLTFNNNFTPTEGATYYVRARVKGEAEIWSDWSTETFSFTYSSSQSTPDWHQTTQAQFLTDSMDGVITNPARGVVTGPGGNRIVNGGFENGLTGWTTIKPSWFTVESAAYGVTEGTNALNIFNTNPGSFGNSNGDNAGVSQTVNMSGVSNLKIDLGYESTASSNLNANIEVYISETTETSLRTGVKILDWRPSENVTTGNTFDIDLSSYGFEGNKLIKIASYLSIPSMDYAERYFYADDVQLLFPPAGTITSTPIHLESVVDATAYEGITWDQTLNGGSLTLKVQESEDGITFSDLPGFDNINEAGDGVQTVDLSGLATPPAHLRLVGALDGAGATLNSWSVGFAGTPEPVYDFVYQNDTDQWTPNYPGDVSNPSDATSTILVMEGTAVFNSDIIAGNLTVNENANLEVENNLKLEGNIINNGLITFKSSGIQETAQFDAFNGAISGNGLVTIERFLPARRSYRFLSSAVSTTSSIRANWQEDGDNTPGLGTHITGTGGAANGFDPTSTNNASMFEVVTNGTEQAWEAVANTNVNTLTAGNPYLLMVRGDRTIDMSTNEPIPTETVLRATGTMATGDQTFTGTELLENQEFFIGNPYQAAVSIEQLLNGATNINPNHYYLYNAGLAGDNGRGQYVTVDMDLGGVSTPTSEANGYLQPGQAILVKATGGVPSVTFKESYKNVNEDLTATFRGTNTRIALQLFYADAYTNGETPTDGISIKFAENGNNGIDAFDAPKMFNFDENLAVLNGESLFSIESRAYPENEEVISLSINSYRNTNYVFEGKVTNLPELTTVFLYDNYTDTFAELSSEEAVSYSFEVNPAIEESKSSSRFELRFIVNRLGVDDFAMSSVALYPNPLNGDSFQIMARGFESESLKVQIVNMLGQVVYSGAATVASNGVATVTLAETIASGIYNVKIVSEDNQVINKKLIKN